ncbi:MAG: ABC transporter permease [Anaerolineae bacterium]|nr:ABC transporter permease [Anaerolineae bacterium]
MNKLIERFRFYLKHSINDLRANPFRTFFALLCISVAVGAMVGLQTFGVIIENTLSGDMQESNRGDIRLSPSIGFDDEEGGDAPNRDSGQTRGEREGILAEDYGFSLSGVDAIREYLKDRFPDAIGDAEANVTYSIIGVHDGPGSIELPSQDTFEAITQPYFVEVDKYPLYGEINDEEGRPLNDLINDVTDVVISRNLADSLEAKVGDQVKISGSVQLFTIRGIVDTREEGGFENILGSLFGYWYADVNALPLFEPVDEEGNHPSLEESGLQISSIFVRLEDTEVTEAVSDALDRRFPYTSNRTPNDLEKDNRDIVALVKQATSFMGLVSLLLGGIGIVNTMLVVVRRRTLEVAVLKTLGLQPGEITTLFMIESAIMGFLGGVLGIPIGWLVALVFEGFGESFLNANLAFSPAINPALTGLLVGVVITTIFGFLPTLTAGQVRPSSVLRPNDNIVPRAGIALSFAAILAVVMALSLVAQGFIGDLVDVDVLSVFSAITGGILGFLIGLAMLVGGLWRTWTGRSLVLRIVRWPIIFFGVPLLGAAFGYFVQALIVLVVTFIGVGILFMVLWVLIWLVGRFFPSFRIVDLKVALRAMLAAKSRGASALLALVIGIFTLSVAVMLIQTIQDYFEDFLIDFTGGNVIVFVAVQGDTDEQIEQRLTELDYLDSYTQVNSYETRFVSYEDVSENQVYNNLAQLKPRVYAGAPPMTEGADLYDNLEGFFEMVDGRDVVSNLPDVKFQEGRQLNAQDSEDPVLVMEQTLAVDAAGFAVGDKVTFEFIPPAGRGEPQEVTFTIVGLSESSEGFAIDSSQIYVPRASLPETLTPSAVRIVVDMPDDKVTQLRRDLSDIPGAFVLETRLLSDLLNRVLDTFTALPTLLVGVSLFTGGIVVANSVALSTMERRREIAIMKAVGLQRRRVLGMLLMENSIMGLLAGLIGVGISVVLLLLLLIVVFERELGTSIPVFTAFGLMMSCVVISLIASILSVWWASSEKPLKVLRYE